MGYNAGWVRTAQAYVGYQYTNWCSNVCLIDHSLHLLLHICSDSILKNCGKSTKSGAYIPGVRPGKGTEDFMSRLLVVWHGRFSIPWLYYHYSNPSSGLFGLTDTVALGGTSLLIIISTGIEGMKQLEGYLLKRKYIGFMDTTE